jgi:hypothetical protein
MSCTMSASLVWTTLIRTIIALIAFDIRAASVSEF